MAPLMHTVISLYTSSPPRENNLKNQSIFLISGDFAQQGEVLESIIFILALSETHDYLPS